MRDRINHNKYHKKYQLEKYHQLREDFIKSRGGVCEKCGNKNKLQIDHINPKDKKYNIAKGWGRKDMQEELDKCQVLCTSCHEEKSIKEVGKQLWKHGTLAGHRYCKCDLCNKAWAEHNYQYRVKTGRIKNPKKGV